MKKSTLSAIAYGVGALAFTAIGVAMGDGGSILGVDARTIADNTRSNFGSFADLMGGFSYIAGLGAGIQAVFKFKAHADNPQQNKLTQPMLYSIACGVLLALPTYLTIGSDTMFQQGGSTATSINGNNLGR